jgi:hypothetical protein
MWTGSGEFAAYAQTLRRMHMAKLLEHSAEAMLASRQRPTVYEVLFGDLNIQPQLVDERVPITPPLVR